MATEIERKFLLRDDSWRAHAHASQRFEQGYLTARGPSSVRVRIEGDSANLNIKAARIGTTRAEYEYSIPLADARDMIDSLSVTPPVIKTRYWLAHAGHTWEIDVFEGENAPLVIAEVELDSADEKIVFPEWVGEEVTDDARYYNNALAQYPYAHWTQGNRRLPSIDIDLERQTLRLFDPEGTPVKDYLVSTAANGSGERDGSFCTPRGRHRIRARIGEGAPAGTVFKGRRPTGEIYSRALARAHPERDWILTRILWLCGEEPGVNRLGEVDTMRRYVYIHGAADTAVMGRPGSIGCVRMTNDDVIDLFDRIPVGTKVHIHD